MNKFEKAEVSLRYYLIGRGYIRALKAMEYAKALHTGLRKDGKTPEFYHQISIALYLRTLPDLLDLERCLTDAFLHDTVEDKDIKLSEIEELFGADIALDVNHLSKIVEKVEKPLSVYFKQLETNPYASVVKGADRVNNHQSMVGVFTYEKQSSYISETEKQIIPMLKVARRQFPEQESAYENIKYMLGSQIELVRAIHEAEETKVKDRV